MAWLSLYSLFLAKIATMVVALGGLITVFYHQRHKRSPHKGELQLTDLSEQYQEMRRNMQQARMDGNALKAWHKQQKKQNKELAKQRKTDTKAGGITATKKCIYVIDFKGSIDASEVYGLREEVSAVLAVATADDEVVVRLESPGGVVHGYGLAASQLLRIRQAGIPLTVVVDKVAASGGYMMACVANKIIAAPFAIIGSIGVVAQIPNFNRWLKRNDIDMELHTAGEFKRTLTLFGENTAKGREKFCEELDETHQLFKQFIEEQRPSLDVNTVATGEHWYGRQAQAKGLVDDLSTSDDFLITKMATYDVIGVRFVSRKRLIDRILHSATMNIERLLLKCWQRGQQRYEI